MVIEKSVPVVLRSVNGRLEILMFRHPLVGLQIIKGTVEPGETPPEAALRELFEESGIANGEMIGPIGRSMDIAIGEHWHFYRCSAAGLPDRWNHHCSDGGGLDFSFLWQPLDEDPTERCDSIFMKAIDFVGRAIRKGGDEEA